MKENKEANFAIDILPRSDDFIVEAASLMEARKLFLASETFKEFFSRSQKVYFFYYDEYGNPQSCE